jgi:hypothetical protein
VAEESIESGRRIKFKETETLAKISGYVVRLVEEAIETKLHPNNISRKERSQLRKA